MEQIHSARRSSGIYDDGSTHSAASLRGHAADFAGTNVTEGTAITRTTSVGVVPEGAVASSGFEATELPSDRDGVPPAAPPPQPFYKKRWFIISQIIIIPLSIAFLFILLFPVLRAIAQLVVNKSTLDVQVATISHPQNSSFTLALQGNVAHTGKISATIKFLDPVNVSWVEDSGTVTPLGTMTFTDLSTKNSRATINQTSTFVITDRNAFGRFTVHMITAHNFTWYLRSSSLQVQAMKFPVAKGISFSKTITLQGFESFNNNVVLKDLQLPSDNPAGGINFRAITTLTNPSPFSLNLGTVVFALSYNNVSLGLGSSQDTQIKPGPNEITLSGTLERKTTSSDLVVVSELFTNYLNGDSSPVIAAGQSTLQSDNTIVSWLSEGLQSLFLTVPFKAFTPIDPIRTITIGDLGLMFDKSSPWNPGAESNTVQASLKLPFGFNLSINEIQNDFSIVEDGNPVAGLSTPVGASHSSISVLSSTDTEGLINISISNTNLSCPESQHPTFSTFNANLTSLDKANFRLIGRSRAVASMGIGQITLDPIKVNVSTSLNGLQGLKGFTIIKNVDVQGGTTNAINLAINVSIFNPSSLNLSTGDLTLQLLRDGVVLGTVLLPNLHLQMGNNSLLATSSFQPNNSPQGLQTLNDFVGKKDVQLTIIGFNGSTEMASLVAAFKTLSIDVTLPGLSTNLLESAALTVLSTTGRENNISHVAVSLFNPFSAPLHITKISSTVSTFGILLGTIHTNTNFISAPKSITESPTLDLNMNFDPSALFTVTRALAVEANLNVAPLDQIVKLGGVEYLPITNNSLSVQRRANIFTGFDLPTFVRTAFKKLNSDVLLSVDVSIGNYQTTLQYVQNTVSTATDNSLNFILPVLAQPIVQRIVDSSALEISSVLITNPQQSSFGTRLQGKLSNAGPFDASIAFPSGLDVSWAGQPLGNIKMSDVNVLGDVGATLNIDTSFEVADISHLTDFTKTLLTQESFDWEISGKNLTVSALGIQVPGITLTTKIVTLKGFNGLKNGVKIKTFDLPSNDPAGGIRLTLDANTTNPSQVGIELSSIGFETFVGNVMIAPVLSTGVVTLAPMSTSDLSLVGRLVPQDSPAGLSAVSDVFNNFVQGKDSTVVVHGVSAGPQNVTWLNEAIKVLQVTAALPNRGVLDIIKSINLNQLQLLFTDSTAYNPSTSSNSTDAAFTLPFDFPIDISALEQTLAIGFDGTTFAQLSLPKAPTSTNVMTRVIHLTFDNVPFAVFGDKHPIFNQFVAATTVGNTQTLHLSGSANADAKTAVGILSLMGINFSIDSSINGLQGLNTKPVTVSSLDVNHGFPDFLLIKVDTSLFNPSNLTIGTGDVSFSLEFQNQTIGAAVISNLVIKPGNVSYPIDVHYAPQGGAVTAGRTLLQNFLQGIDVETTIAGSQGSTPIESLKSALSAIRLSPVSIPALHQTLIQSVSLTFPTNIVKTGVASTSFVLKNPFTASINLLRIGATATFHGIFLGKINNIDVSSNPIHADGHSSVTSTTLPLQFNLQSLAIVQLLTIASQENRVDLGPLTQLFQFLIANPDFHPPVTTSVDTQTPTCVSGQQFDVNGAILKTLQGLRVDLAVQTSVKLDDFATDLSFDQISIPAMTDKTALFLIGAVAGPVAQHLVDGSTLLFTEANITNISDGGFDLSLAGALTGIGPLDALITFTEALNVSWKGQKIAQITLPPICAAANTGVPNYRTNAKLAITDLSAFTSFTTFLLQSQSFDWTISTPKLRVTALGTVFDNVSLSKVVTFKAFNNLPGVSISNFQLPSDDPAGGIHIETDAVIPSAAQLGIDLGTVNFQTFFKETHVGPLSASHLFLTASSITSTHLTGRIIPQSGTDLNNMGELFSKYLAGENQTLVTKGDTVQPDGSNQPVIWLSDAFKTLSLEVILPGQHFDVIQSIQLNDLNVTMQSPDQAFAPLASSESTLAEYKNPFGFSLQIVEAGETIVLGANGNNAAQLVLPKGPANGGVSTGNVADLDISFHDQPLKSLSNAAFAQLFAGVTLLDNINLTLKGSADVSARTTIGDVPISGVLFNVASSLKGINSFGHTASLSNVSVRGSGGAGGNQYIVSPLTTTLQNPSNISLDTVGISLPVIFKGVSIGRAAIGTFDLKPGANAIATEFHYQPADANDTTAQSFLTEFLQTGDTLALSIHGDQGSSPFPSLSPGLANLVLASSLTGLNHPDFITHINVYITLGSLITNFVSVDFDVYNPLDADLILEFVQSDDSVGGKTYAHFDQGFPNFVIPPGQTVNSGVFPNVALTQGALASLVIIGQNLDVAAAATIRIGQGGYQIPWLKLAQTNVPTSYHLPLLSLSAMKTQATQSNGTSMAVHSTSNSNSSSTSSAASTRTDSLSGYVSTTSQGLVSSAAVIKPSNAPIRG